MHCLSVMKSLQRPLSSLPENADMYITSFVQRSKEHCYALSQSLRPPAPARRPISSRPPTTCLVHLTLLRNNHHSDSHRPTPRPRTITLTANLFSDTTLIATSISSNTARHLSTILLYPIGAKPIPATTLHLHPSHSQSLRLCTRRRSGLSLPSPRAPPPYHSSVVSLTYGRRVPPRRWSR